MDKSTLRSELINKEQYYLDLYKPVYNFSLTAGAPNTLGKLLSPEHRAAIGKGITGRPVSPETRERIAATKRGELNPRYGYSPSQAEREASRLRMPARLCRAGIPGGICPPGNAKNNPMSGTGTPVYVWIYSQELSDLVVTWESSILVDPINKVTLLIKFDSVYQACKELNADNRTILKYLDSGKLFRKEMYLTSTEEFKSNNN